MARNDRQPSKDLVAANGQALPAAALPPAGPPSAPDFYEAEFTEEPSRHLRDYLRVLHKYRWLAGICFVLTVQLAVLVTLFMPSLYTASTRLQVARQGPIQLQLDENVLHVDDSDRGVNGTSSFVSTQVEALQSRDLAERVIRSHGLADNDAFLRPRSAHPDLFSIGGQLLRLVRPRGLAGPPSAATDGQGASAGEVPPALLNRYMSYLSVKVVRGADLIEVTFTTPSAALSAFLAAAHTQAYVEANDEARLAINVTAKDFLGQQLRESREQLELGQEALSRFAAEHPNVAVDQEQKVVGQRIAELSSLLTKVEATRIGLQSRYEFLTRPESDAGVYFLDRAGVQKLHLTILDLRTQRAKLGQRLGPKNVQMAELQSQEAEVQQQLGAEVIREIAAVHTRYAAAQLREEQIRRKLTQQAAAAAGLRELGMRYALLKGNVDSAQGLHASLLKQQMETAVNSELVASNLRVVERAEVAQGPSQPNVPLNLTLGVLAGLVFGVGAAFACEYFDDSVKSSEEVQGLLQLSTLATIPNFELARRASPARLLGTGNGNGKRLATANDPTADLVVLHEPRSSAAEAFRSVRTAVLFSTPAAPPRVILVTSAVAGEGKTVNALNLATTLADGGSRVILLDADLRWPSSHRVLGVENDCGLSSYLTGQAELESVIRTLDAPRFSFIPAGPTPPNPAELVGSARMQGALAKLLETHDFVILDGPPVLPVTDAVVLAREADGVILVVKGQDTPRELARRARDHLQQAGARLLGVVVNNVDFGWGDLYYYGPYYAYDERPAETEGQRA